MRVTLIDGDMTNVMINMNGSCSHKLWFMPAETKNFHILKTICPTY